MVSPRTWFPEWEFRHPGRIAILSNGRLTNSSELQNSDALVIHGELDFPVPVGEGSLFTALQRQKFLQCCISGQALDHKTEKQPVLVPDIHRVAGHLLKVRNKLQGRGNKGACRRKQVNRNIQLLG
jgi:hypothetical protein